LWNFRRFPWVSSEDGYLTVEEIAKRSTLRNKQYYICGPESLKAAIRSGLVGKKVSRSSIHDERFAFK
jgi:predicted ferric reductase